MGNFWDWFYEYKVGDILVVPGIDPALFKINGRNFGRDDCKYIFPHKYYNGIGIKLIQDDIPTRDGFKKFSLRLRNIEDKASIMFFVEKYTEEVLYRPGSVMFHEGSLEKARQYLS